MSDDGPIYSNDPREERRMIVIRDTPGDRVRMIAQSRVANPALALHPTEWLWLREGMEDRQIPLLKPVEWDALVRLLMGHVSESDVQKRRHAWERTVG